MVNAGAREVAGSCVEFTYIQSHRVGLDLREVPAGTTGGIRGVRPRTFFTVFNGI